MPDYFEQLKKAKDRYELEQEKKRYNGPRGYTQEMVDHLMAESWRRGFEEGARAFADKHRNFLMMSSLN